MPNNEVQFKVGDKVRIAPDNVHWFCGRDDKPKAQISSFQDYNQMGINEKYYIKTDTVTCEVEKR